jgi:hypothetical protein
MGRNQFKNCGNLGKKSISKVQKAGKITRKYGNFKNIACSFCLDYRSRKARTTLVYKKVAQSTKLPKYLVNKKGH